MEIKYRCYSEDKSDFCQGWNQSRGEMAFYFLTVRLVKEKEQVVFLFSEKLVFGKFQKSVLIILCLEPTFHQVIV